MAECLDEEELLVFVEFRSSLINTEDLIFSNKKIRFWYEKSQDPNKNALFVSCGSIIFQLEPNHRLGELHVY
ncbi:MAG: hypothetical protein MHPSP_000680, partial [Paramarteilia canceri]